MNRITFKLVRGPKSEVFAYRWFILDNDVVVDAGQGMTHRSAYRRMMKHAKRYEKLARAEIKSKLRCVYFKVDGWYQWEVRTGDSTTLDVGKCRKQWEAIREAESSMNAISHHYQNKELTS